MPEPTGPQWVQVYRGLHEATHDTVMHNSRDLGIHWTPNYAIAHKFAERGGIYNRNREYLGGAVISAYVHRRHIIDKDDPTAINSGVFPDYHPHAQYEDEITLRPGAPVHVRKLIDVPDPESDDGWDEPSEPIEFPLSRKSIRRA